MDLPKVPEFAGSRLAEAKRDLAALGIVVSDLGASARMHEKDPAVRAQQFDEGRRFIDLAQAMGVKYVRMFGDKIPEGEPRDEVMKRVVEGFRTMADYAKPAGVTVLIESHGDFTRSADLENILTSVASPQFALLWDAHHSFVAAGEQPADTFAKIGKWTRHTHLKDSKPEGCRPALRAPRRGRGPGEGTGQGAGRGRLHRASTASNGRRSGTRKSRSRRSRSRTTRRRWPTTSRPQASRPNRLEHVMSMDDKVSRREFLEKGGMAVGAVAAMPALLAAAARPKPPR